MATPTKTETPKPAVEKVKKDPVPVAKRISDQLKRQAVNGKMTKEELENIAALAKSLVVFLS